ncbi:MAG: biotin carboxylase N-terminal domain-containing protein [Pseudomonadota bacterium]
MARRIETILIANRGEIARRVMRTAKRLGKRTVAVYSDVDRNAPHVRDADEAVQIGGSAPADSYLKIDAVIDAAKRTGADAIHPGYGFLSERADFTEACAEAGVVFIGPKPGAVRAMGDKAAAKRLMIEAGVPCVPGYQGKEQSDERLISEADAIGFPVMVKASAGGGGRGMRRVGAAADLPDALKSARSEAENAFGDGRLILEKAVDRARHIEVQVFGDAHGNLLHFGERECSVQRRHQKVIEEAPSPALLEQKRAEICAAAVAAARAVDYENAGTVEFLYDDETGDFYFLEMNTRLQVEHPVTEEVTGFDLVALQIAVAEGEPLPIEQEDIEADGWSIEARLYAEDAGAGFLPQTGRLLNWRAPEIADVRIDAGVETGSEVSAFYDPMVAKVIACGETRDEARRALHRALGETRALGLTTNTAYLRAILDHPTFADGAALTRFLGDEHEALTARPPASPTLLACAAAAFLDFDPSNPLFGWSGYGEQRFALKLDIDGEDMTAAASLDGRMLKVETDTGATSLALTEISADRIAFDENGRSGAADIARDGAVLFIDLGEGARRVEDLSRRAAAGAAGGDGVVRAPMAGAVIEVRVAEGDAVKKGDVLIVMEAMKMQHRLEAPIDGVVETLAVAIGAQTNIRDIVAVVTTAE